MGGTAGTKPGFTSGVATGAVGAGAGAIALFKLVPLGQIMANNDSYIGMLNGAAIFALVTLCSLLIYGQLKELLSGSAFSTLNLIVYVMAIVIVLDVGVLGYRASFTEASIGTKLSPNVSEMFQDYDARINQFTFSHDAVLAPDEHLRLAPMINASAFQTPKGTVDFLVGDAKQPIVFQLGHLEQLETAYSDLKTRYEQLLAVQKSLHDQCTSQLGTSQISSDCKNILSFL